MLYIFGEDHFDPSNIERIHSKIKQLKPDYILHELLYSDTCETKKDIQNRLNHCKVDGVCDPRLNKDIYQLGLELNAKLIGIDTDIDKSDSLKAQFEKREDHMVNMIDRYIDRGVIVVVVGDTHLRSHRTGELGRPSPIFTRFKDKAKILRANEINGNVPTSMKW